MINSNKIQIKGLTKYYGSARGIEDLNLDVKSGEIFGFLGPNGAGKSTTIRCIMNILLPTKGKIQINGGTVKRTNSEIYKKVGYIPEAGTLPEHYTSNDFLNYVESMRGVPSPRRHELVKRFKLPLKKKIGELSKGNKQKISIISAFMHEPDVLILDEPTSGLDPLLQQETYELILEAQSNGSTIFFSSHNLAEVQRICSRVGIVKDGFLIDVVDVDKLNTEVSRVLDVSLNNPDENKLNTLGKNLLQFDGTNVRILVQHSESIVKFLEILLPMEPMELSFPPASLEHYFMHFYEDTQDSEV
jgi:ABC-2 type transport system ATP-binding protein